MKFLILITAVLALSSCDKLKKMEEGMEATRKGMTATQEGLRKQKLAEASKIMLDSNNRKTLSPIPSNMMSAAKAMGEAITADEMLLWTKNYLIKVNEENFADTYPLASQPDSPSEPTAPTEPVKPTPEDNPDYDQQLAQYQKDLAQYLIDKEQYKADYAIYRADLREYNKNLTAYQELLINFTLNKAADLQMITLVSGFVSDSTIQEMIELQSEQGAYRDVLFAILKMRVNFYNDVMLEAGLIGGDKKLATLGQIEKAVEYTDKIDFVCRLPIANQVAMKITGFTEEMNAKLSEPLQKDLAAKKWAKVLDKAQKDFRGDSFAADPAQKDNQAKEYAARYKALLQKIQSKLK
ncbi:MAG: hypothetical protein K0R29_706 [Pseudobdellovibrio sp.]|jgi:hypothetical protein|nr:hypothetical protein [Pseudobdellovibrio sp.]